MTSTDQKNSGKSQTSLEGTSPTIVTKKSQPAMKLYMIKEHRRVALIDRADKNGTITSERSKTAVKDRDR